MGLASKSLRDLSWLPSSGLGLAWAFAEIPAATRRGRYPGRWLWL